jgi:hypothetical protein
MTPLSETDFAKLSNALISSLLNQALPELVIVSRHTDDKLGGRKFVKNGMSI